MLSADNIRFDFYRRPVIKGISAFFQPGQFSMILGPNGSGKSTFLKIISGELKGYAGTVQYGTQAVAAAKPAAMARCRAVMSQQSELSFPLTVEEVVLMGRYPHFDVHPRRVDTAICTEVMERLQLGTFRQRNYLTLSGGEKQRVQFARVLAQVWEKPATGCRYLFLDEPLASLDINYQQEFLQIARAFADNDTVLVAVMHDINLATQYGDCLYFIKEGGVVASGHPADIINPELIDTVFGVQTHILPHPVNGYPLVVYR